MEAIRSDGKGRIKPVTFSEIASKMSDLPTEKLEAKIKLLTIQLTQVSDDFDKRIESFTNHTDIVRKLISSSRRLRKAFNAGELKEFEKEKETLNGLKERFGREVIEAYNNIKIVKQNKGIIIVVEDVMEKVLEEINKRDINDYRVLEEDWMKFQGTAKRKVLAHMRDDKKDIEREAKLVFLIRKLVSIISDLDEMLDSINMCIEQQQRCIENIEAQKGKTVDTLRLQEAEKLLSETQRNLLEFLRHEKQKIHDPLRKLIREQRSGLYHFHKAAPWIANKLLPSKKITDADIRKAIYAMTDLKEFHAFFAAMQAHKDMLDERTAGRLEYLFEMSEDRLDKINTGASIDALTQLMNKKNFWEHVEMLLNKKAEFCMIIIDIDKFKDFNDTYGHAVGDKVLKEVATLMINNTRPTDLVFRFGGEEMSVLLPRTSLDEALRVCERLRKAVESHEMKDFLQNKLRQVTISAGVIYVSKDDINNESQSSTAELAKQIFEKADALLYMAKHKGRNTFYGNKYSAPKANVED